MSPGRRGEEEEARRAERLLALAAELGVPLPPFPGPLVAFDPDPDGLPGPIYLGGDLHATHPDASVDAAPADQDRSLDQARITIEDFEHPPLVAQAIGGIWCIALEPGLHRSAPYFTITDGQGRLRTWILLPPISSMVGLVQLWLPQVPPAAAGEEPPSAA